jgi:hypothetical protein
MGFESVPVKPSNKGSRVRHKKCAFHRSYTAAMNKVGMDGAVTFRFVNGERHEHGAGSAEWRLCRY